MKNIKVILALVAALAISLPLAACDLEDACAKSKSSSTHKSKSSSTHKSKSSDLDFDC